MLVSWKLWLKLVILLPLVSFDLPAGELCSVVEFTSLNRVTCRIIIIHDCRACPPTTTNICDSVSFTVYRRIATRLCIASLGIVRLSCHSAAYHVMQICVTFCVEIISSLCIPLACCCSVAVTSLQANGERRQTHHHLCMLVKLFRVPKSRQSLSGLYRSFTGTSIPNSSCPGVAFHVNLFCISYTFIISSIL